MRPPVLALVLGFFLRAGPVSLFLVNLVNIVMVVIERPIFCIVFFILAGIIRAFGDGEGHLGMSYIAVEISGRYVPDQRRRPYFQASFLVHPDFDIIIESILDFLAARIKNTMT